MNTRPIAKQIYGYHVQNQVIEAIDYMFTFMKF